ncbi:MAG: hypothetical protein ACJA2S_001597 [Cyclobacteriaceae bacterium]|jgi:hypothetical protein
MDDLDIKKIWSKSGEIESKAFDSSHLDQIIERGSVSIIEKFVKTLRIEMVVNFIMLSVLVVYSAFQTKWALSIFLLLVDLAFFIYYRRLVAQLRKENIDINVLAYLRVIHKIILKFITHYKVANVILAVPLFTIGMYFANPEIFTEKYLSNGWFIVLAFVSFAIATLLFYLFLFQFYGKKANKIERLIEALKRE